MVLSFCLFTMPTDSTSRLMSALLSSMIIGASPEPDGPLFSHCVNLVYIELELNLRVANRQRLTPQNKVAE